MLLFLLMGLFLACSNSKQSNSSRQTVHTISNEQPIIPSDLAPDSLTDLARTPDGSFVLAPGLYQAEFRSFCLQPGTPDPSAQDAYLQAPITGYRRDIVETILYSSRIRTDIPQRNIQLLLWSVVSGSDFNKLPLRIQDEATQILSSKQLFELKGGVIGMVKAVSGKIPYGLGSGTDDIRRLFELGTTSYENFERMAVLRTPSTIKYPGHKVEQWYKQRGDYFVRYFPINYQKIRIQVFVPNGVLDSLGKRQGEYLIFDPSSWLAVPANSNAQKLGVGGPVVDIIKKVIEIDRPITPKRLPEPTGPKQPKRGT